MTTREKLQELLTLHQISPCETLLDSIEQLYSKEEMKPLNERITEFKEQCRSLVLEDRSNTKEVTDFFLYFSENSGKPNSKMKWEKQQTFNINLRFARWMKQADKYRIVNLLNGTSRKNKTT